MMQRPGTDREVLLEVTRSFFGECRLSVLGSSPGYSGSLFAHVDSSGERWLLRRWPEGFSEGRLRFIHRALLESSERGFQGVPRLAKTSEGETVVEAAGRLHDAQEWLSGRSFSAQRLGSGLVPNRAVRLSHGRLVVLAEAVGRFHRSTMYLHPEQDHKVEPLTRRLGELASAAEGSLEGLRAGVHHRTDGAQRETALRWLELLPSALRAAREASLRLPSDGGAQVLCHGDLWPTHVRFEGNNFVGFTDFESLAFAPPTLDLAQLVAHFGGWDARAQVLGSYERLAPLGERSRAVLALEAIADLVGEGLWSLKALYGRPSCKLTRVQYAAHAFNLGVLLEGLEAACRAAESLRDP